MALRIPYGISDFGKIALGNYAYIDKTHYIEALENRCEYALFLRPRRFGKSMLLSMLEYYYDYKKEHEFERIFSKTWIGSNPTSLKNSFAVLKLDLSGIKTDSYNVLTTQFSHVVGSALRKFAVVNGIKSSFSEIDYTLDPSDFTNQFLEEFESINDFGKPIYLIIDEYDQYANALLGENVNQFKSVMGASGFIRTFYEVIKKHTTTGAIGKIFISGVAPIAMDSLTSGLNIADDLTQSALFHDMVGFTHEDVKWLLKKTLPWISGIDALQEEMAQLYNGYKFSYNASNRLFNSGMALYYLKEYWSERTPPRDLLDKNVVSDYSKIKALASIDLGNQENSTNEQIDEAKRNSLSIMKAIAVGDSQPSILLQYLS
jgi:hypothetical protein